MLPFQMVNLIAFNVTIQHLQTFQKHSKIPKPPEEINYNLKFQDLPLSLEGKISSII